MGKVIRHRLDICNGCYNCQVACKDEHVGNDWSPIAKPQPDTGQFWNKVNDNVRGTVPKVQGHLRAQLCQHCDDAPCITACPVEGAIYKRDDGLVDHRPGQVPGCNQLCVDACPYDVIYFNDDLNIAQKCTVLRPPARRRLDRAALRRRLPDRSLHSSVTRTMRDHGTHRQGRAAQARARPPSRGCTTSTSRRSSSPAPCTTRKRTSAWRAPPSPRRTIGDRRRPRRSPPTATATSGSRTWRPASTPLLIEKPGYLPQKMGPVDRQQGHERRRHRGLEGLSRRDRGEGPGSRRGAGPSCFLSAGGGRKTVPGPAVDPPHLIAPEAGSTVSSATASTAARTAVGRVERRETSDMPNLGAPELIIIALVILCSSARRDCRSSASRWARASRGSRTASTTPPKTTRSWTSSATPRRSPRTTPRPPERHQRTNGRRPAYSAGRRR